MRFKPCLAILAALMLMGCEQAQMNGPITGGNVSVSELRSGDVVYEGVMTPTLEQTAATWDNWDELSDLVKLMLAGIHQFNDPAFEELTWYVMAVEGGFDLDRSEPIFFIDENPFQVQGKVQALVTGARLNEGNFTLSPVTEAAYQLVRSELDSLDDAEIEGFLDDVADQLVGDVDGDGTIEYNDVLEWNYLLASPLVADTDALTQLMEQGASQQLIQQEALALFAGDLAETLFADGVSDIVQSRCGSCHGPGGSGSNSSNHDLVPTSNPDHVALNVQMYRDLVTSRGADYVLNKATGSVSHGGGSALTARADIASFQEFLSQL